jgi:hypothetical protein
MSGIQSFTDGIAILENGILNCDEVNTINIISDNVKSIDGRIQNNCAFGDSIAIGNNITCGKNIINSGDVYTNTVICEKIKISYTTLPVFKENMIGHIKTTNSIIYNNIQKNLGFSLLNINLNKGIYVLNYNFSLRFKTYSIIPRNITFTHGITDNTSNYFDFGIIKQKNTYSISDHITLAGSVIYSNTSVKSIYFQFIETDLVIVDVIESNLVMFDCEFKALRIA